MDVLPGNPLAEGYLMLHQRRWVADDAQFKVCRKGRRTGITYAEALNSTLKAGLRKNEGGDTTHYVGDTKEKAREFVDVCATFAKFIHGAILASEEFLFDYVDEGGEPKSINAFRITFASGNKIVGLSGEAAAIRGLQGRVVVDEAAFHRNMEAVIDAAAALVIWGSTVCVISSLNGKRSPFTRLCNDIEAGKYPGASLHTITFDDAVEGGLYERACLTRGWTPSAEGKADWYRKVRAIYGPRIAAMREELDVIPRDGDAVALATYLIERCQTADQGYTVLRWEAPEEGFVYWPEPRRRQHMREWLERHVRPALMAAGLAGVAVGLGLDFAMRQDRTAIALGHVDRDQRRRMPVLIELRQCPYDQQRQVLFWFREVLFLIRAMLDAAGNGMALAQEAAQHYGADRVVQLTMTDNWLREVFPTFRSAFEARTLSIPVDPDITDDLGQFREMNGVARIPSHVRKMGSDGGKRHGDAGVAILLCWASLLGDVEQYAYRAATPEAIAHAVAGRPNHDGDTRRVRTTSGVRARPGIW